MSAKTLSENSKVSTLLAELRKEHAKFVAAGDKINAKKIAFVGRTVKRLIASRSAA